MSDFPNRIADTDGQVPRAIDVTSLVVSLTLRCNQRCTHCHVSSSPSRREMMGREVMERVVWLAESISPQLVDLTGGAPELNPDLASLVRALRSSGLRVQLRTNLTALLESHGADLARLYAEEGVELLASMPCYTERNVRAVRGVGVHDASIRALRRLNALGYGTKGGLRLALVYNPVGTTLPEDQGALDAVFRDELSSRFDITFTELLTMTNMPVGRFGAQLRADGAYDRYLNALEEAFNPDTVPFLQCRHEIEVGWDGRLYDCDFNLGAGRAVASDATVWDVDVETISRRPVAYDSHCFGCTAGAGSS